MKRTSPALMGAALVFATILPVAAATALLSVRSAVREGPGNEFRIVGYVDAGQFPLGECRQTIHGEDWCYVDRDVDPGWIHVVLRETSNGRRGSSSNVAATEGGSSGGEADGDVPANEKGTTKRTRPNGGSSSKGSGDQGMSPKDAASLPSSSNTVPDAGSTTKGDRLAAAGPPQPPAGAVKY
jgi:uncharacterized protein YraI